jgi:hypothetical protein
MCLLCLLCSADCDNTRCANPKHVTCRECTYEWNLDRSCLVCKHDTFSTVKKPRREVSRAGREAVGRNFVIEEFSNDEDAESKYQGAPNIENSHF